jgi:hypothetical protein
MKKWCKLAGGVRNPPPPQKKDVKRIGVKEMGAKQVQHPFRILSNPEKSLTRHLFNNVANKPTRSEPNSASSPGRLTPLDGTPDTH